jgi:hypothetical protein
MRTTITLPDALFRAAKRAAQEQETTLSSLVANALRALLSRSEQVPAGHFSLVTFRGDGSLPGVDVSRTSALYEIDDVDQFHVSDRVKTAPRAPQKTAKRRRR